MQITEQFNPTTENFEIVNIKSKKFKTKMRDTSLLAYADVIETLGERQIQVFRKLRELKFASNFQLSKELGLPVNRITPRIKEMRDWGIVMFYKKEICPETKKLVIYWKPRNWDL
jgi:predicted transcriptional regulator